VLSTRNINSELIPTVATSTVFTDRRGEHNIPKRYLKEAEWYQDGYLETGYYTTDPYSENTTGLTAVDFNFETLQWGLTEQIEGRYRITRPAPVRYRLRIFDKERTDQSGWGPIDGINDEEEDPLASHSDSEAKAETPQIQTQLSPPASSSNMQLLHWLNSFPHTLPYPLSPPSADYLCWLQECHKSHQLPLSLQQVYWPELLELEYLQEEFNQQTRSETLLEEEEGLVENLLEEPDHQWDPQMGDQTKTQMLEEGEILETLEEGEIPDNPLMPLKIDSLIN
jgi:hypothetical protein